ncbi:MAG: nicotinate phosphoribosyltransferase, partial [Bacteroidaceae bacterium]
VDRNKTKYPPGFAAQVMEQVQLMDGLSPTEEEIKFLKERCGSYMYSWFFVFLRGLSLHANEVSFWQTKEGYLEGRIQGPLWRTIYWEQPLLAIVSELVHQSDTIEEEKEYTASYNRAAKMIQAGVDFSDMGTRRRFSKKHHEQVVLASCRAQQDSGKKNGTEGFVGTSNVWLAMRFEKEFPWLKCIGTMSHQMISAIAAIYGPREANYEAIERWNKLYRGEMGTYLFDCLGSDVFLANFSKQHAKLLDGYRVDSGDNMEEFDKIYNKILSFKLDPIKRHIIFSNGLQPEEAIAIHRNVAGRMKDSYGIGTSLTCNLPGVKPSNIVIKLTGLQLTPRHPKVHCIKLSSSKGKATGDPATITAYRTILGIT